MDAGADTIVLGIGGSASTDGGAGMVQAFGGRLVGLGRSRTSPRRGARWRDWPGLDLTGLRPPAGQDSAHRGVRRRQPADRSAGRRRGVRPAEGRGPEDVEFLDAALAAGPPGRGIRHPGESVGDFRSTSSPGPELAGGVGFAAIAAAGRRAPPGIDLILDLLGFHRAVPGAHGWSITGEGSLDEQTLSGKAPVGVAAAAAAAGIPVVAVCGRLLLTVDRLRGAGIQQAYALTDIEPDVQRSLTEAGPLLEQRVRALARDWLSGPVPAGSREQATGS